MDEVFDLVIQRLVDPRTVLCALVRHARVLPRLRATQPSDHPQWEARAAPRWDTGVVPDVSRIHASAPAADIAAVLQEDGAVIVEELIDDDLLARFNAELDPLVNGASPDHDGKFLNEAIEWFFGQQTYHVTGVAGKSPVFANEILPHPVLLGVADVVLDASCASYQLNIAHVLDRGPGSEQQYLHRDEAVWIHLPQPHPEVQLASVIALVDFTADNGATRVAPGSHRWPADRVAADEDLVPAEMAAGSAVLYLGSTIHAGGGNVTSDRRRRGMHVSYCAGWLRTEENQFLTVPLDAVRAMPRRSQELLGFAAHDALAAGGGYLGAVELQHPVDLLADGALERAVAVLTKEAAWSGSSIPGVVDVPSALVEPASVRVLEEPARPVEVAGMLGVGLEVPLGALGVEEVAAVHVQRDGELALGVRDRVDDVVAHHEHVALRQLATSGRGETFRARAGRRRCPPGRRTSR